MNLNRHLACNHLECLPLPTARIEMIVGDHLKHIDLVEQVEDSHRQFRTPTEANAIARPSASAASTAATTAAAPTAAACSKPQVAPPPVDENERKRRPELRHKGKGCSGQRGSAEQGCQPQQLARAASWPELLPPVPCNPLNMLRILSRY